MNKPEFPPQDDKKPKTVKDMSFEEQDELQTSLEIINLKKFEDPNESIGRKLDDKEYAFENELSKHRVSADKKKIEALMQDLSEDDKETPENERWVDTRPDEEKQQLIKGLEKPPKKVTGFKKFKLALAVMLGMGIGGQANASEKNPADSTGKTAKIESLSKKDSKGQISDKLRRDHNLYVDWLEKKGLKGSETLDHNDLAGKMIDEYRKENPGTSISRETIDDIQEEFEKYKEWVIMEIKAGRAQLAPGVKMEDFMKNLSGVDNIAGSKTTSKKFPDAYLKTYIDNNLVEVKNKGFAKIDKNTTADYSSIARNK